MLKFFDVDTKYTDYLRQFEPKIPYINYGNNNKFVCGIVLSISEYNYFAPISSNKKQNKTSLLIKDRSNNALSSIRFSFMFPAPSSVLTIKDFKQIKNSDSKYADLLLKEYQYCRDNEPLILMMAEKVHNIGCNPNHVLSQYCCSFKLLEEKSKLWNSKLV